MRAFVLRPLAFAAVGLAAVLSGRALAQSDPPADDASIDRLGAAAVNALLEPRATDPTEPEEITVEGRRLNRYRLEMERAREDVVETFNEVNSGDDNDVTCGDESPTGTRTRQRVCRSNAASQSDAAAAKAFLTSLLLSAGSFRTANGSGGAGGAPPASTIGTRTAQGAGVMGGAAAQDALQAEMERLLGENRELYRAVVKYVDRKEEYDRERGSTTVPAERELAVSIEVPAPPSAQCAATATTEYRQLNTIARVNSALSISECAAASGGFTVALRVRDESGADKVLEFSEPWQRSDDQDVKFAADYPIGENVQLMSTRIRGLTCTCGDATSPAATSAEPLAEN